MDFLAGNSINYALINEKEVGSIQFRNILEIKYIDKSTLCTFLVGIYKDKFYYGKELTLKEIICDISEKHGGLSYVKLRKIKWHLKKI